MACACLPGLRPPPETVGVCDRGQPPSRSPPHPRRSTVPDEPALIDACGGGAVAPPGDENVLNDRLAATPDDGSPLSDQEVRNALITILITGHDTTALALAWALAEIVPRPEFVDLITDGLSQATGCGPTEAEELAALEHLDGAIRERLPLRPVVPFVVRLTNRPFVADGREYAVGVVLCPCSYLVHRRGDLYLEADRFLQSPPRRLRHREGRFRDPPGPSPPVARPNAAAALGGAGRRRRGWRTSI